MGILGNPELLSDKTTTYLKKHGVTSYQLSIDGMEKVHDEFRRLGSFRRTLEGIRLLNKHNLRSVVMFTLSKQNMGDLIPVINLAAEEGVSVFDFARIVPIGKGVQFREEQIKPEEYRDFLLRILEEYKALKLKGCKTYFGRKDHLWRLLYKELGLLPPLAKDKKTIFHGCSIGIHFLTIVADGTVYSCRRLPIKIGQVPSQSLRDIFIKSTELNEMRQVEKLEKCSKCDLLQYCRGCPAVSYGTNGNYFSADPQCWARI
jgi:radical SAM protein with 4Fe4S-binding SPASM domain